MQSTIDVSTAVCESAGIKRAASPCLSLSAEYHQPPQHKFPCPTDQVCYYKRQRTSDSIPSLKIPNTHTTSARAPPSIVWRDFRNQDSLHNFFTKASIKTPRGVVDLERVQVDERSPFNLVPWSIATNLDLMLYSGKTLAITIAHHLIQTKHYSQFTIRVAGHNTTINTSVVSGLQTILLGREWIRSVHLLSDFENRKYYIPIPLAVKVAEEEFPDIVCTEAEAKDVKPVHMATSDEIAEEHDDDEFRKADCGDDHSNGQSSRSEPSFDGQNLLDSDTPPDEPSSADDTLSDGGASSEVPISGKHEVTSINNEDDSEDDVSDNGDEDEDEDVEDDGEDDDEDDSEDDESDNGDEDEDEDVEDDGEDDGEDDSEDDESDNGDEDEDEDVEDDDEDDDEDDSEDDESDNGDEDEDEDVEDDGEDDDEDDGEDDGEEDDSEDYEDYKGHEGKVCDECEGCEECDGFDECEGCEDCNEYNEFEECEEFGEGEEDPDGNLQDFRCRADKGSSSSTVRV